mmetsp:Transcript_15187/g.33466  ORF Transcript_15187/g.33466 Transcript_15187/m.33466 type:complete len:205 (-) Transcript_15187:504-1118(-)
MSQLKMSLMSTALPAPSVPLAPALRKRRTTSGKRFCLAILIAVTPFSSTVSGSAPAFISSVTIGPCPDIAANIKAVQPSFRARSTVAVLFAVLLRSCSTTPALPPCAAIIKGVAPSSRVASAEAFKASNKEAASVAPNLAASKRAVPPFFSRISISAPASSNSAKTSLCPVRAAIMRGVKPSLVPKSTWAFASINAAAMSGNPN